jgi:hypothetical protein
MFTSALLASAIPRSRRRWRARPPSVHLMLVRIASTYRRSLVIDGRVKASRERSVSRHGRGGYRGSRNA